MFVVVCFSTGVGVDNGVLYNLVDEDFLGPWNSFDIDDGGFDLSWNFDSASGVDNFWDSHGFVRCVCHLFVDNGGHSLVAGDGNLLVLPVLAPSVFIAGTNLLVHVGDDWDLLGHCLWDSPGSFDGNLFGGVGSLRCSDGGGIVDGVGDSAGNAFVVGVIDGLSDFDVSGGGVRVAVVGTRDGEGISGGGPTGDDSVVRSVVGAAGEFDFSTGRVVGMNIIITVISTVVIAEEKSWDVL